LIFYSILFQRSHISIHASPNHLKRLNYDALSDTTSIAKLLNPQAESFQAIDQADIGASNPNYIYFMTK
jgi:hypothetical protein